MNPYEVVQRGYDSSGRPLRNTRMKWQVFDKINDRMDGKLVIVQGAFMGSGGASASAGTHNLAGCNDVRRWNLTTAEAARTIDIADSLGDIWWERTAAQGFDPHFHNLLPNDKPLHNDAAWQVTLFRQGKNGLASGAPDMPGRLKPFPVYQFEEDDMFEDADRKKLDRILERLNAGFTAERQRDANALERHRKLAKAVGEQVDMMGLILNKLKDDESPTVRDIRVMLKQHRKALLLQLKDDPETDGTPDNPSDEAVDTA